MSQFSGFIAGEQLYRWRSGFSKPRLEIKPLFTTQLGTVDEDKETSSETNVPKGVIVELRTQSRRWWTTVNKHETRGCCFIRKKLRFYLSLK